MNLKTYLLAPFTDIYQKRSSHGDSLYTLDGLRGIAVIIVLMSHTAAFGMYGHGSLGVLLFFFLSGFVLTLPYTENPKTLLNKKELFRYVINRILRIVPLYIVIVLFYTLYWGMDTSWFFYNVSFLKGWNHFWSVAEEVRFYILFPFVIILLSFIPKYTLRILILSGITYYFYKYSGIHKIDLMDGRHVSFYFWMFLGGSLTSFIYSSPLVKSYKNNITLKNISSVIVIAILLFIFLSSDHIIRTLWQPLFPSLPQKLSLNGWRMPGLWFILFSLLLLSVTTYTTTLGAKFLQSALLRHLGLVSYSLYLIHMHFIQVLQPLGFRNEGLFVAVLTISWMIALITYITIEKPFMRLKPKNNSTFS
ncbi:MAG: acyltransferase [Bacteroidales bacterium]|nr:acyltransferase [Bacteroidales bacterium]